MQTGVDKVNPFLLFFHQNRPTLIGPQIETQTIVISLLRKKKRIEDHPTLVIFGLDKDRGVVVQALLAVGHLGVVGVDLLVARSIGDEDGVMP